MENLEFDVVICGTGITSAIIGACLSCNGKRVLHIDRNNFYGGSHATVTLKQLLMAPHAKCLNQLSDFQNGTLSDYNLFNNGAIEPTAYYMISPFSKERANDVAEALSKEASRFSIDFWPLIIYSKSAIVELILRSGADAYLRFTDLKGPVMYGYEVEGSLQLTQVPNSKSSIFRNSTFTPMEKRIVMRFISELFDSVYIPQFTSLSLKEKAPEIGSQGGDVHNLNFDGSWNDFLRDRKCSQNVQDLINYGICMGNLNVNEWSVSSGAKRLFKYLESIGIYGETGSSFLYTMYGTGDLAQAFCRIAAVRGSTFMLNTKICNIDKERRQLTLDGNRTVTTKVLLSETGMNYTNSGVEAKHLHVVAVILNNKVLPSTTCAIIRNSGIAPIVALQVDYETGMTPLDHYIIHLMVVDDSPGIHVKEFDFESPNVLGRLLRCFKSLLDINHLDLDIVEFIMYTSHQVSDNLGGFMDNLMSNFGCLEKESGSLVQMLLPSPSADPMLALIEQVPLANHICKILFGKESTRVDPFDPVDLSHLINVDKNANEPDNMGAYYALEYIIDRFSN
ncbi:bifunctional FAD-NAD(P)-binding domain superfamily/GDP dissociation inhibitor [Babesia duncani]|uniref:Bifunctional FAD-NAD(P)-binding domain superfamily/GDP dissociation inhibitor n=1 Tax=Babesia duncani TaxID=323732 RepID=A0AAD9PLA1_9APIC|nr:bifunctional FAD-NAD(P)-binding domain superfamily/GDP dissociation inhibitor [Babesia duncani]